MTLPTDYLDFASSIDKGFVGESYLSLWDQNDLAELNRAYEVELYCPGLLGFGSNGGGEMFGFDTRNTSLPVVQVPFIGMSWTDAIPVGNSFSEFLSYLRSPTPANEKAQ